MPLNKKKIIRDATITAGGVLSGGVGYGNNFERIVGTYEPFIDNICSVVLCLENAEYEGKGSINSSKLFCVDYTTGDVSVGALIDGGWYGVNALTNHDFSYMKKIVGYKLDNNPIIPVSIMLTPEKYVTKSYVFVDAKAIKENSMYSYPLVIFQKPSNEVKYYLCDHNGSLNGSKTLQIFYEPI